MKYFGVFFISLATLMLEIALIKLFSVIQSYHFAFLIVSIAMFGMAAAGTFLYVRKLKNPLYIASILFSVTTVTGFLIANKLVFDPVRASFNFIYALPLFLYYILLGLPFFFFGIIITFSFTKSKHAGKIYFFNLLGSAIGSMLALPFIALFGERIITVIAVIGLISAYIFNPNKKIFVLALILILIPINLITSDYKEITLALNYPNSELLESKWNTYSRIDVVNSSFTRFAPGLSSVYRENLPEQIGVLIDGGNMNAITQTSNFINYLPTSIAYSLIRNPKVLIINPKGGLDVVAALHNNAEITAVEPNSLLIKMVKKYADFYNNVNLVNNQGRSYLRNAGKFDIIILSLSGNVYGLYGLSQDYELTTEAFNEYYDHLTDNGYLIITRWLSYPPRESLRLFSLALQSTTKENIAMFRSWTTVTLVIGKNLESYKIKEFTDFNNFDIVYLPSEFTPNTYAKFEQPYYYLAVNQILNNEIDNYLFDVSPVTDDKPFYYNFFKLSKISELKKILGESWQPFNDPGFMLMFLLFQAFILSLVFILLPIRFTRKKLESHLLFFFFIGLAYLFVEIVFIQKFILLLNNITHSSATVILFMLLFSSFGALLSNKFRLKTSLMITIFLILCYYFILPIILNYISGLPITIKIIATAIIIAPVAFFMGMPFPIAIKKLNKKYIPWAFAINGSASVLSTILAILIAVFFGYSNVLISAALLYLLAMFYRN